MTTVASNQSTVELVDTYLEMWRASDAVSRRALVERVFVADGRHVDPLADVSGHDALTAMLAAVHAQYPGFQIARTSGIDQHGEQVRFAWSLEAADGAPLVTGLDTAEVAPDGRFARVAAFWGALPDA